MVNEAVAKIQPPRDGKDADWETIRRMVKEVCDAMPKPIDGADGRDGLDGRDAIELEILSSMDEGKSYPRGTYATHNGGLWRAYEKTTGRRGWECFVDGVSEIAVEQQSNRSIVITVKKSSGSVADLESGHEWAVAPLPFAHETYHRGELLVEQLLGLIGGVGWLLPAALAYQRPMLLIHGGWGHANGRNAFSTRASTSAAWYKPCPTITAIAITNCMIATRLLHKSTPESTSSPQCSLLDRLSEDSMVWIPAIGIGWYPVEAMPYNLDYWETYRARDLTDTGAKLTQARIQWVQRYHDGPVCDIGIGGGRFVDEMNCSGYDINCYAANWLHAKGSSRSTGALARAIVTKRGKMGGGFNGERQVVLIRKISKRFVANESNIRTGRAGKTFIAEGPNFYGRFLEDGTKNKDGSVRILMRPFIRPAFLTKREEAVRVIKEDLLERLEKIAQSLLNGGSP